MKISRDWATPITIGAFGLMAVTGILMFFHLDSGLNKLAHEWLSWVMVAGVLAHAIANWAAFKRYFLSTNLGRGIIALFVVLLAGSFASLPGSGGGKGGPPPVMAMRALSKAPIASLAPIAGRPTEQLIADLAKAGITITGPEASIDSAIGNSRELQGKAMAVLFGAPRG